MPHRPVRQRKVHNVFVGEAARNRRNGCGNSCGGSIPDGLPANSQSIPWNLESFSSPAKRAMENMLYNMKGGIVNTKKKNQFS